MSAPYDPTLREHLRTAARDLQIAVIDGGVYACFEGPRFESRAEIAMAAAAGATVVGMTGVPEVVLAGELGLPYAALCLVANPAAGRSAVPISMSEVTAVVAAGSERVLAVLGATAARLVTRS